MTYVLNMIHICPNSLCPLCTTTLQGILESSLDLLSPSFDWYTISSNQTIMMFVHFGKKTLQRNNLKLETILTRLTSLNLFWQNQLHFTTNSNTYVKYNNRSCYLESLTKRLPALAFSSCITCPFVM